MRLPNSYGSIAKLSGKRRNPWIVRITTGYEWDPILMRNKQIQKPLGYYETRADAIKALSDYNDCPYDLNARHVTFDLCYQEARKKFTEGRRQNYEAAYKYLEPIKDKPIRSVKAAHMQRCIDACDTTQQREIKTVCRKVFDYALFAEYVDRDPSQNLKSNTVEASINRTLYTPEEIAFIEETDKWWKVCLACLLYSGMRTKELRTLEARDINLDDMTIDIVVAKNKRSIRKIPIHTHAEPFFRQYKAEGIGFYNKSHDGYNKVLRTSFNVKHLGHDSRHTFATKMHDCEADFLCLQKILGHTPTTITEQRYIHITMDEMRENIELLRY